MWGQGAPQQGYPQRTPYQQPQHPFQHQQQGPPPPRAGLGAPGAAGNLPPPPNLNQFSPLSGANSPSNGPVGERWTMFVNGIADVDNGWLERILGTAGTVLSLKRPSPAFAFVEYGDPESVLRCLEAINGVEIPGKAGAAAKPITVKADAKTKDRLDTYEASRVKTDEASRVKTDQSSEYTLQAQDDLAGIVKLMASGAPPATSTLSHEPSATPGDRRPNPNDPRGATYLQDLAPEDLKEDTREVITSEIALFRERAAKKAAEKKAAEELRRSNQAAMASQRFQQSPQNQNHNQNQNQAQNGWGPRGGTSRGGQQDPQSYNKPIGFVGSSGIAASPIAKAQSPTSAQEPSGPPAFNDEERERERLARERREAENVYRENERRLENRERGRINAVERERASERAIQEREARDRAGMSEHFSVYDDDRAIETGREPFYADRQRWRAQRRVFRAREAESDAQDRAAEASKLAALQKQSEDFLSDQADMFASLGGKGKGLLHEGESGDGAAVKLSFGASAPKPLVKPAPTPSTVLGAADDEEDGKKRRKLIPLTYDDVVDEAPTKPGHRLTAAERDRKSRDVLERIPVTKESLWAHKMLWADLSEHLIRTKLSSFATKTIVSYLGDEEDELLKAVLDHVRAHKGAAELVEELEPVLDEDATEFVRKIWKELAYELALAHAGLA